MEKGKKDRKAAGKAKHESVTENEGLREVENESRAMNGKMSEEITVMDCFALSLPLSVSPPSGLQRSAGIWPAPDYAKHEDPCRTRLRVQGV